MKINHLIRPVTIDFAHKYRTAKLKKAEHQILENIFKEH